MKSHKILDISVTVETEENILKYLEKYLVSVTSQKRQATGKQIKPLSIVTPNPEQIVYAMKYPEFREMLNQADVAIPDGVGIVFAYYFLLRQVTNDNRQERFEQITGISFMQLLVSLAEKNSVRIGLMGGTDDVAVRTFECLQKTHPHLDGTVLGEPLVETVTDQGSFEGNNSKGQRIKDSENQDSRENCNSPVILKQTRRVGGEDEGSSIFPETGNTNISKSKTHPPHRWTEPAIRIDGEKPDNYIRHIANRIISEKLQMIFVGLGAPKQEYMIYLIRRELERQGIGFPVILMAVGGSFDEISGRIPMPPGLVIKLGLKWLWRLILEPWRWRRQVALVEFAWLVLRERFAGSSSSSSI